VFLSFVFIYYIFVLGEIYVLLFFFGLRGWVWYNKQSVYPSLAFFLRAAGVYL